LVRRSVAKNAASSAAIGLSLLLLLGVGCVAYLHHWAATPLPLQQPVVVELRTGDTFGRFAAELKLAGVINDTWTLTTYARWVGRAHRIQAGEYRILVGETPAGLLADLVSGSVVTYEALIVEGSTIMRVFEQLAQTPKLVNDVGATSVDTLMAQLRLRPGHAEGQFFPDTYGYKKGTRISDILRRAHARMQRVLAREWSNRAAGLPYATPQDALIMASIIEKETGHDADRTKISRVFVSRLQRSMRLQTDPAVIYGLGDRFDGNLTRAELDAENPYNTYRLAGLPPTPIALPGLASIRAALHPDDGDYLYFVARGDGTSEFSATLQAHLAAVKRYQLDGKGP
jgi:peptidoglycan lytic transglycosylase G